MNPKGHPIPVFGQPDVMYNVIIYCFSDDLTGVTDLKA